MPDLGLDPGLEADTDMDMAVHHTDPAQPDIADLQAQIRLLQAELDLLAPAEAALVRAERRTAAMQTLIERQSARLVELQAAVADREQQIAELHRSLSWRATAPLRTLRAWLRGRS